MPALDLSLDTTSPVPLYHQIASQLQEIVEDGRMVKGDFLPSEIELAEAWGVSRPTARRAIQSLVEKGMLSRQRGVGTRVIGSEVHRPLGLTSLYDDLVQNGRDPETEVISLDIVAADTEFARQLETDEDDELLYVVRLRKVDGEPIAFMRNWLLRSIVGDVDKADLEATGLYDILRSRGVHPRRATQVLGADGATHEMAQRLGLDEGAPVLTMERLMRDGHDQVVEFGMHCYNPRRYSLTIDLAA